LKRWCNVTPENLKSEIARFEDMILAEGARLKAEGKKGLEILPGVATLLDSVSKELS
jgi:glycerol 3-phosphatase-1